MRVGFPPRRSSNSLAKDGFPRRHNGFLHPFAFARSNPGVGCPVRLMPLVVLIAYGCGGSPEHYNAEGERYAAEWAKTEEEVAFQAALRAFNEAIHLDPKNPKYHYNVGTLLAQARCYEYALPELKEAVRLSPESKDARNNLEYTEEALAAKEDKCESSLSFSSPS